MTAPLRVGRIGALNMYPIYHGLERAGRSIEFLDGPPTTLNNALLTGDLDVSAVSSIAYARNSDLLTLLPVASITARGAVDSIQLFSNVPFDEVQTVAVTPESATSVTLLRLLLGSDRPPFELLAADPRTALRSYDGVLLIGDEALFGLRERLGFFRTDLAERWYALTGQPMVFAVWAARAEVARDRPDSVSALAELIHGARSGYSAEPEAVVRAASRRFRFTEDFVREYLGRLHYDFGADERAGLACFLDAAAEAGLLRSPDGRDAVPRPPVAARRP
ncbi:MAG: menaquinone biosynthetic enzyme MqnA/MqnD family protein [Miltoncostaeaceae bacterium]